MKKTDQMSFFDAPVDVPTDPEAMAQAQVQAANTDALAALSGGSVGGAMRLSLMGGAGLYGELVALLGTLPHMDRARALKLAELAAARGGEAKRVSFSGEYNARATVSFDGKKIAMAQGAGNVYRIVVLDRSFGGSGRWQTISPGNLDESPSFAPNASMILYATKQGRRGVLYAVSADGRVRQRLVLSDGDVREPAWSPYR